MWPVAATRALVSLADVRMACTTHYSHARTACAQMSAPRSHLVPELSATDFRPIGNPAQGGSDWDAPHIYLSALQDVAISAVSEGGFSSGRAYLYAPVLLWLGSFP